ncbi:hypothetical protein NLI96_g9512 [Meripilus lineatus]|uniref:Glutathione S-transferase n=1 Tax=Meripilus lineatus TaxID=2056292 RepID=A0AAD5UWX1_9APHY|nr:hypothetical protein NLI96_g9512 [Physisporinus lineatus]
MSAKEDTGKSYHLKCTGDALTTANAHTSPSDITLFAGCFCPFVQRVWVALEYLGIDYHVSSRLVQFFEDIYEVDPYKKPAELLEVSPKGLVPAIKLNNYNPPHAVNESTVILEFLEEPITPTGYWSLHFIVISKPKMKVEGAKEFIEAVEGLIVLFERAATESNSNFGLWKADGDLGLADVMAGPWLFRATNVLPYYRGFTYPDGPKFHAYLERLLNHPAFKKTCSTKQLYIDSYERYVRLLRLVSALDGRDDDILPSCYATDMPTTDQIRA